MSVAIVIALAAYPLLAYAIMGRFGPSGAAALLAAVCLARLVVLKLRAPSPLGGTYLTWLCGGGLVLAVTSLWLESTGAVLY